jgi:polyphenol oxidase
VIEQRQGDVCYLQFNLLAQFPELTHGVFTRLGGYSRGPYRGLNISMSGGDNPDNILRNRLLTLQTLQLETYPCATLWLVHGADVATLGTDDTWDDWRSDWPYHSFCVEEQEVVWTFKPRRKADAIITRRRDVALALSFGDCPSILFYDPVQEVLGMAHAGWRGTARGVAAATVEAMREQFGSRPGDMWAGIGPSIGPCCYEVSPEVQQLFQGKAQFAEMPTGEQYRNLVRESAVFSLQQRPDGGPSLRLDLWQTNRNQLLMAGLLSEHIELPEVCTSCNTDRFFSYRGEHGITGRFPALLALRPQNKR